MFPDTPLTTLQINDTNNTGDGDIDTLQTDLTIGIVMSIFGIVVMATNGIALTASRYTTGGRCPEMIFIRTLCVADTLAGLYGFLRPIQLLTCPRWANCFLAEALLFTSFMASNLTLVLTTVDCYVRICHHALFYVNKTTVIFTLVVLWNAAFVIGFVPQMDLNDDARACSFFHFYNTNYLVFVVAVFATCMVPSVAILAYMHATTHRNAPISCLFYSAELAKDIVTTVQLDVAAQVVFSIPFVVYLMLYCHGCRLYGSSDNTTDMMLLPIPFLLKSLLTAVLHCVYSKKIKIVLIACCHHYIPCCVRFNVDVGQDSGAAIATILCIDDSSTSNTSRSIRFKSEYPAGGSTQRQLPQNIDPATNGYYNPVSLERLPYRACLSSDQVFNIQQDTSSSTVESDSSLGLPSTSWIRPPYNHSYMFRPSLGNLSDFYPSTEGSSVERSSSGETVGPQQVSEQATIGGTIRPLNSSDNFRRESSAIGRRHSHCSLDVDRIYYGGLVESVEEDQVTSQAETPLKKGADGITEQGIARLRYLVEQERTSRPQSEQCGARGVRLEECEVMSPGLCERRRRYGVRSQSLLDGLRPTRLDCLLERDETRFTEPSQGEYRTYTTRSQSLPEHFFSPILSPKSHQRATNSLFHSHRKKPSFLRLPSEVDLGQSMQLKASVPCGHFVSTNVDPYCPIHGHMQKRAYPGNSVNTVVSDHSQSEATLSHVTSHKESDVSMNEQSSTNRDIACQFPLRVNLDDYIAGFKKMRHPRSNHHLWSKSENSPANTTSGFSHQRGTSNDNGARSTYASKVLSPPAVRCKLSSRAPANHGGSNHIGSLMDKTTKPFLLPHTSGDLTSVVRSADEMKHDNPIKLLECPSSSSPRHFTQSEVHTMPMLSPAVLIKKQLRLDVVCPVSGEDILLQAVCDSPPQASDAEKTNPSQAVVCARKNICHDTGDVSCRQAGENISCNTPDVDCDYAGENISCNTSDVNCSGARDISCGTADVDFHCAGEIILRNTSNGDYRLASVNNSCDTAHNSPHTNSTVENISATDGSHDPMPISMNETSGSIVSESLTSKQCHDKVVHVNDLRTKTNSLLEEQRGRADISVILNCRTLRPQETVVTDTRM